MVMRVPCMGYVDEGKTASINFNNLLDINSSKIFVGVPWRLRSARFQFTRLNDVNDPALVQVFLNTAATDNVEGVVSFRHIVTSALVLKRTLRPRNPNPWKEDEDRTQSLIMISNIAFGSGTVTSRIFYEIEVLLQFGSIPFGMPKSITSIRQPPSEDDDSGDDSSIAMLA